MIDPNNPDYANTQDAAATKEKGEAEYEVAGFPAGKSVWNEIWCVFPADIAFSTPKGIPHGSSLGADGSPSLS